MTDPDGLLDAFEADLRGAVSRLEALEAGEHLERDLTADRLAQAEEAIEGLDRRVASLAQTPERDLTADGLEWAIGALDRRVASLAQTLKSALIRIEVLEDGS